MEIAKMREQKEALRQDVRAEVVQQQVFDRETANTREETRIVEQYLKKARECELLIKARFENIKKDSVSEDQRHLDTTASISSSL
jgi:hypothetical protein